MAEKAEAQSNAGAAAEGFAAYIPAIAGWIVPGGGHFWQGRWGRGLLLLVSILGMFMIGVGMRGKLFPLNTNDVVDMLGWAAQAGSGGVFFIAQFFGYNAPEPATAMADYGTKFLLTAGLLNCLAIMDAYDIAVKRKD
jgi:hypothetical protein